MMLTLKHQIYEEIYFTKIDSFYCSLYYESGIGSR